MTATSLRNTAPRQRRNVFFGYVVTVVVLAVSAVVVTVVMTPVLRAGGLAVVPTSAWLMAAMAIVVELRPVLPPGSRHSQAAMISLSFIIALLPTWGYLPALIVQTIVAVLIFTGIRAAAWRTLFNAAQFSLALTAAHFVLLLLGGVGPRLTATTGLVALLTAGLTWFLVSHVLVCVVRALRFSESLWRTLTRSFGYEALVHGALLTLAPILAVAADRSAWLVLCAALPIYVVYRMARLSTEREHLAATDALTGLPNRKGFQEVVEENLSLRAESGAPMAVLVCDIDRFAAVNNALGHDVGDRLLRELSRRFVDTCRHSQQVVARVGGDEFAFLLAEMSDEADAMAQAALIQSALAEQVWLDEVSLDVSGAIGVACHPQHGTDVDALFRHASVAMAEAKSRGSAVAMYAPEYDHHSAERLTLLGDLRRALEDPKLPGVQLYYQPQVALATGEVMGVEALLRYRHPTHGNVDASELISLAEHSAVMRILTYRVIDQAVGQLASWLAEGLRLRASVNVSVRDLHALDFCDYLTDRLEHHRVPPELLQLEITESALMADPRRVVATLSKLDKLGVGLSLDDFGTGFSSMQHLRRLQVSEVKIDKSFVLGMRDDPDATAIVRSIIELGRALALHVVAEGVEDEPTWRQLVALGCDTAQGWFHARPMPAADLAGWLARYRPPALLQAVRAASPVITPSA